MGEQLPGSIRVMVRIRAMLVRIDMGTDQPQLSVQHAHVRLADGNLAIANRLDLGTGQNDAGFQRVADFIVMERASVLRDDPVSSRRLLIGRATSLLCHVPKY